MPKAKVIRAYGTYRVGDIIQPTGVFFDYLKSLGLVERVEDDRPGGNVETAEDTRSEPVQTATRKRKRRPKKSR